MITMVVHDPDDRQADGRWEGTIVQKKVPVREIKWAELYDRNSDVQYSSRQLMQVIMNGNIEQIKKTELRCSENY